MILALILAAVPFSAVGAIWLNRCTMPGRCRSTPMQMSVSSRWVMAAYRFFTGGS